MIKGKCAQCGRFSLKYREIGKEATSNEKIDVPSFRLWKFCSVSNEWCKIVASHCKSFTKRGKTKASVVMESLLESEE